LYDNKLLEIAKSNDYKIVLWTIDTKDWEHRPADEIVNKVLGNIKSGDIILFHDYISGVNNTPRALEILIPRLQEMGFNIVTVSELLQS
jgi:peptidoglycan/xylan/chitin deacetylase (PgdA/CDA1 family)